MQSQKLDIVELIELNPITKLSKNYQGKFIEKIQENFTESQQQLFIASFYCYLNYNSKTDFVIELENIWKWLGFGRKEECKRVLTKHFTVDNDYKILKGDIKAPQVGGASKIKGCAGLNKEKVLMTIRTFKKLCLKSNTAKADEIHDYFIKLEELTHETITEESLDLKLQLEEKEQIVMEQKEEIQKLENKPETKGFSSRIPGELYCIRDKSRPGHMKIGIAEKTITRVDQLNVGSPTKSLEMYAKFDTFDRDLAEKLIHHSLHPFLIAGRKEWFFFKNDLELAYAIKTIKISLEYIKQFDIKDFEHFNIITENLDIDAELIKSDTLQILQQEETIKTEIHMEKIRKKNIDNGQKGKHRTDNFKGTSFVADKNNWIAQLQHNKKHYYLGEFVNEIEAAQVYNDFALFLNETENNNFLLNDIPGYVTVARNIPELNKLSKEEKFSSKYIGVSYDSKKKYYVSGIRCSGKTYNLGNNVDEIECAKLYNQQALFFNNTLNTKYILNEIEDYITIAKDIHKELMENKLNKKTSKYNGVYLTKSGKWECRYMLNRRGVHIGTFKTELEACKAYNETVIELNKNGCNYKVNVI
jgi:hypothetical protein